MINTILHFLKKQSVLFYLGYLGLLLLIGVSFQHSLFDVARSDQVNYLAEVGMRETFHELALQTHDLNRIRTFAPGDEILYRPVLYFILGAEKFFFGYNFVLWQFFGLVLHTFVVFCLWHLLFTIRPNIWSWLTSAFFAVLFIGAEMVVWHHINAYMLALGLLLIVLRQIVLFERDERACPWVMAACLLLACFTYEIAVVFAFILAIVMATSSEKPAKKKMMVACLIPAVIYVMISMTRFFPFNQPLPEGTYTGFFSPFLFIAHYVKAIVWWWYSGLWFFHLNIITVSRTMLDHHVTSLFAPIKWSDIFTYIALMLAIGYGWVLGATYSLKRLKENKVILLILSGMLIVFPAIIALGRATGEELRFSLGTSLYYQYVFWLFTLILLFVMVDFKHIQGNPFLQKTSYFLMAVILIFIGFNAQSIYRLTYQRGQSVKSVSKLTQSIGQFVNQHKDEEDFSFYLPPDLPGNYEVGWLKRKGDSEGKRYNFIEVLFPKHYTKVRPKYMMKYQQDKGRVIIQKMSYK